MLLYGRWVFWGMGFAGRGWAGRVRLGLFWEYWNGNCEREGGFDCGICRDHWECGGILV